MGQKRSLLQRSRAARPAQRSAAHPARAFLYRLFVVFPKRCENLIRFSISHRTTWTRSCLRRAIAQAEGDLPRAATLLAPLHPNADDTATLQTQVYQAILERRPAPIIPRLKEILAKPDPALGFYNGELRFFLGWAQEVGGDHAAAQESWRQARSELESFLKEQPDNYALIGDMALTSVALGDKAAALALAQKATATSPLEKDAIDGSGALEFLARVLAQAGEPDRAITVIQKLLSIPSAGYRCGLRSLLRCSGSIRCSIRSGMIRASRNSRSRKRRNKHVGRG